MEEPDDIPVITPKGTAMFLFSKGLPENSGLCFVQRLTLDGWELESYDVSELTLCPGYIYPQEAKWIGELK